MKYVKYLESDGNSYFNTITSFPSGTYKIEMKYNDDTIISTHTDRLIGLTSNVFYYQINQYGIRQVKDVNRNNDQYIDKVVNNVLTDTFEMPFNTSNLRIFHTETVAQIYYVKLYDTSDNLLYHFRGALDDNNTPCLHEVVNDIVYYNNGTGTFAHGDFIDALYLFADNNEGTAENLGSYRLYNMKIEGDSEGVESGVDYVDCLIGDSNSYIDTGMTIQSNYKIEVTFMSTINNVGSTHSAIFGVGTPTYYSYDFNPPGISLWLESNALKYRNNGTTTVSYDASWYNKKYTQEIIAGDKVANVNNLLLFTVNDADKVITTNPYAIASNCLRIYDFKIYNAQGTLIQHLRPCLDTEGVPCMYDEVSGEYFENQGTGTFGYKKELRDFQPVLDSNNTPCLMDKINKKYYYDKNGNGFKYNGYTRVGYLEGVVNRYINTNIIPTMNTRVEVDISLTSYFTYAHVFGSDTFMKFQYQTTSTWLYISKKGVTHSIGDGATKFEKCKIIMDMTDTTNLATINGTNWGNNTGTTTSTVCPIILFSGYDQWGGVVSNEMGQIRIHSFKIYESNELIFDGIPVLDNEGTPCMYDLVTETFFYGERGDGEFGYGAVEELECPPANYVEYIRGSKNAYINTLDISGMINSEVEVEWKFNLEGATKATGWFGTVCNYNTSPLYARNGWVNDVGNAIHVVFLDPNNSVTIKTEDRHLGVHVMKINKTGLYMDGNLEAELPGTTYYNNYDFVQPFALLGYNYWNGIQSRFLENVLYYVTVKQAGELILDFRPCLDEDGVLCVYEAVNGVYYYNSDTGEFGGHGKSIGYTPIKYIETNGTQYIDTDVVPTDNTDIDMVARAVAKEYTPVEYLQGDGASYIDTGIPITTGYDIECNYRHGTPTMTGIIFGLCDKNNPGNGNTPKLRISYIPTLPSDFNYDNNCNTSQFTDKIFTEKGSIYNNCTYDNTGSFNCFLFGASAINVVGVSQPCWMTDCFISMFKVWDAEGNLVQHLISVLDSEGTPCMYDLVTKQFFYNQGTGTFSYGDVLPSKNYLMNDFYAESTYNFKETNTTVEPNLTASAGATLTLGSTYSAFLTETEIEQAINNGWTIE